MVINDTLTIRRNESWVVLNTEIIFQNAFEYFFLKNPVHFIQASMYQLKQWNMRITFTHCGIVTPYGDIDVGPHWLR